LNHDTLNAIAPEDAGTNKPRSGAATRSASACAAIQSLTQGFSFVTPLPAEAFWRRLGGLPWRVPRLVMTRKDMD